MDKREYQEKLQEINRLIAAEDYEGAAKIADSIDWKRVRNVQTLVMISEVYEVLERYEDSKVLLLRAYLRSPVGRTVLYRLVECCIKLRQFDQAIEYYSEYVQAAPHDNNKYILKYKIYRGRGSSLDEQIDILKEYLDQEYNEKWAYELARLQIQAGNVQEGLATCDDLVLWFHSGKYVIKALEMKKKYAPLTPKQQEIYDNRFDDEDDEPELRPESYLSEAASLAKAERAAAAQEEIKTELAADISHTAKIEATKAELSRKAEEAQAEVDRKAAESRKALSEAAAAKAAEEISAQAEDAAAKAAEEISSQAEDAAAKAAEEVSARADEAADTLFDKAEEIVTESAAVQSIQEDAFAQAEAEADTLFDKAEETTGTLFDKAEETTGTLLDKAEENVTKTAAEQSAREEASANAPTAGGLFDQVRKAVSNAAQTMEETPKADAVKMMEAPAREEAAEETPDAGTLFDKAQEAGSETAETFIAEAGAQAEETAGSLFDKAEETVTEAAGAAEETAEALFGKAEEAVPQAEEIRETEISAQEEAASTPGDAGENVPGGEAESEPEEAKEPVSPEQMQADMIRSMREIVSGVGPRDQIGEDEAVLEEAIDQSKEDQENAVAARGSEMTFRVPESEASQKRQAGRLTIDDILLSMGDGGDRVRQVTGGSVMSATEEANMTAQQQAEAKAASYDAMNPAAALTSSGQAEKDEPEIPRFLRDDVREARQTSEIPAEQIAEADDAMRAQMGLSGRDEAAMKDEAMRSADAVIATAQVSGGEEDTEKEEMAPGEEAREQVPDEAAVAAAFIGGQRVPYTKEIAEAKTRRLPVDEIRKLHEAYMTENAAAAEEAAKNAAQAAEIAAEMAEAEAGGLPGDEEDIRIAAAPGEKAGASSKETEGFEPDGAAPETAEAGAAKEEESRTDAPDAQAGEKAAGAAAAAAQMAGAIGEQVTREVPKSEPEPQLFTGRPVLKESQMDLFRGFTSIGNLPEQIAGAIWQAENRRDDRTSRSGNILILGAHGCGKTTIATGIAKAIAEDMGTHSVKMARIYAADLNRKDIAATIAKIAGGVLIVEEAGDLDDAIVDQLTTAMEFRTDGLIMILEDEQRYIHDLLMRHPRFTMKFTAQIYIPEYTGEELVNFGQIYANSKDYVFSEKAVEACRSRVEAARKDGEAVSVTNVIELVDRAIRNANTFFRRIGSAKRRYDSEDRVILREKDFR